MAGVEFQIAEPPSLTTEESFVEPLEVGTTPANPNDPTVDPSLTTATTPGTTTTTEFKLPNNNEELNFEKLVEVSSKMASLLQSGKLSESLGVNVTSMEATKPIEPPEEEPEYTSPEERAAVLDKTFAEKTAEEEDFCEGHRVRDTPGMIAVFVGFFISGIGSSFFHSFGSRTLTTT